MKLSIILLLAPAFAWASCVSVQVSATHRDISCTGNAPASHAPKTMTTYVTVGYPTEEQRFGYYPQRVTGVVAGGQRSPAHAVSGWGSGGAGRQHYGGRR